MLLGPIVTILALSSSVLAVPGSWQKNPRAAAPAPRGALKQTSRGEILTRQKRKLHRPARRAIVSRAASPNNFGNYYRSFETSGQRLTATPASSYTILATVNEPDALSNCIQSAGALNEAAALSYSNANDIYTCSIYDTNDATTVAEPDNGLLIYYQQVLS